ncbi:MAG: sulfatase [bacterium]|nr:sulfatase [bacterium]
MKRFLRLAPKAVVATVIGLGLAATLACAEKRPEGFPDFSNESGLDRPNVLVVLIDALRRDHLGAYGYELPTTPAIDTFAAESAVFTRAYSHSSWTKPSVATLFTSLYPDQHGMGRVGFEGDAGFQTDVLPKQLSTLAERFKRAGYRTGSIGTNVHIQKKTGFAQGFSRFFNKRLVTAYQVNDLLREWLEAGDQQAPFFAYAHYMDVHFPYNRRLPDETGRFGSTRTWPKAPTHWTRVPEWAEKHLNSKNLAALIASYDQEVAYVDGAFGELWAWLGEIGRLKNTVVVLVADHGEGFNEHDELQHGYAPYEEVTAIPFMIRLPPVYRHEPGRSEELVGLVDVMPTVLDLVGLKAPRKAQGRSLVPLLLGESLRERPIYVEGPGIRGLRGSTHTLFSPEEGEDLCFDNQADPSELSPLEAPLPEICGRMASALDGLVAQLELVAEGEDSAVTLDAEEVEALRALGYLD